MKTRSLPKGYGLQSVADIVAQAKAAHPQRSANPTDADWSSDGSADFPTPAALDATAALARAAEENQED